MSGAGEMALDQNLNSHSLCKKPDQLTHVCHLKAPTARWEAETESPALRPARHGVHT